MAASKNMIALEINGLHVHLTFTPFPADDTVATVRTILKNSYVDAGRPLTYNQAVQYVSSGKSVFAVTQYEAKAVARAAGGTTGYNNKELIPEIGAGKESTPGYYYHFHTYNRKGGHVYYLFP